jgi:hypothetical protein
MREFINGNKPLHYVIASAYLMYTHSVRFRSSHPSHALRLVPGVDGMVGDAYSPSIFRIFGYYASLARRPRIQIYLTSTRLAIACSSWSAHAAHAAHTTIAGIGTTLPTLQISI